MRETLLLLEVTIGASWQTLQAAVLVKLPLVVSGAILILAGLLLISFRSFRPIERSLVKN